MLNKRLGNCHINNQFISSCVPHPEFIFSRSTEHMVLLQLCPLAQLKQNKSSTQKHTGCLIHFLQRVDSESNLLLAGVCSEVALSDPSSEEENTPNTVYEKASRIFVLVWILRRWIFRIGFINELDDSCKGSRRNVKKTHSNSRCVCSLNLDVLRVVFFGGGGLGVKMGLFVGHTVNSTHTLRWGLSHIIKIQMCVWYEHERRNGITRVLLSESWYTAINPCCYSISDQYSIPTC